MQSWQNAFSKAKWNISKDLLKCHDVVSVQNLSELKTLLDMIHVREALLRPYFETKDYPCVESRSLLPSFEADTFEYKHLPGFSLIVLDRQLSSFQEIFQYDMLHSIMDFSAGADGPCCPLESHVAHSNLQSMLARMPRMMHEEYRKRFQRMDITVLEIYQHLLPYLLEMDRAHVIAKNSHDDFQLTGLFASLPSDIDGEIKRFGLRIGKFSMEDSDLYERNRNFVMQFIMELYGFPIAAERRSSAALFSRRLHKIGEKFMIRVLGQSDRTITSIWNDGTAERYPYVEKIALIRIDEDQIDNIAFLKNANAFVNEKNRVAIIRTTYQQHAYNNANVRQDRALTVSNQQIIHPITGEYIEGLNIIKDSSNLILRLNDIVRGEFNGRILYKRTELVENTDNEEKRLKFLYAWLSKHQRRIIGYSEDFFKHVCKIIDNYMDKIEINLDDDHNLRELIQENNNRYSFIQQARKVRCLEEIRTRKYRGEQLTYERMITEALIITKELRFELIHYFAEIVESALYDIEAILNDRYLCKKYIDKADHQLTSNGVEIKKKYRQLVRVRDEFLAIRKSHKTPASVFDF